MHAALEQLFSLDGRVAVVTGGNSGIGRAMAVALCRAGAAVVLVARNAERSRQVVGELRADGGAADLVAADLATRDGVHRAADAVIAAHGAPDVLVNAAGVNLRPPLAELDEDAWDRTMALNLDAPFVLGQRFGPLMAERGWGRIIHVTSQQAVRAFANSGAYGASKAGLAGLTRSQAEAWSARGVRVNAVAPGAVRTPLNEALFADPDRVAALARRTMVGRNGLADDFAGVTVFLASDAAEYVTGQMLFVDGGFSVT